MLACVTASGRISMCHQESGDDLQVSVEDVRGSMPSPSARPVLHFPHFPHFPHSPHFPLFLLHTPQRRAVRILRAVCLVILVIAVVLATTPALRDDTLHLA